LDETLAVLAAVEPKAGSADGISRCWAWCSIPGRASVKSLPCSRSY